MTEHDVLHPWWAPLAEMFSDSDDTAPDADETSAADLVSRMDEAAVSVICPELSVEKTTDVDAETGEVYQEPEYQVWLASDQLWVSERVYEALLALWPAGLVERRTAEEQDWQTYGMLVDNAPDA